MKYRSKYEYTRRFGNADHTWVVIGPRIGLHLHISDRGKDDKLGRYNGGIEIHYRHPPEYMKDDAPSHDKCWVLGCPCWHDGSSLQVSELWIPLWRSAPDDHDRMFRLLEEHLTDIDRDFASPGFGAVVNSIGKAVKAEANDEDK